jgi:hypothetical protein
MEQNKAEFYKLFLNELQKKQIRNSPDAKAFEEKLFALIGSDLDNSGKLEKIEAQVRKIANKFDVIDKESEKRAWYFYKNFPTTTPALVELKTALTKNYELYEINLKREDHKQAARYAIIQLEGVLNFLEQSLINWIEKNAEQKTDSYGKPFFQTEKEYKGQKYINKYFFSSYNQSNKYLTFKSKCLAAQEFLTIKYLSQKKIVLLYDIRNYESHQFSSDQAKESEEKLLLLKSDPTDYYGEVFTLIKNSFSAL